MKTDEKVVSDPESAEAPLEEDSTHEYYHGMRLAVVVVSLLLGTFLVALDNVCQGVSTSEHFFCVTRL